MDLDDGVTLRAADDPTIKNELRRAWIADRLDERLGEFGETHTVDVVCATWNANGKDVTKLNLDLEPWLRSLAVPARGGRKGFQPTRTFAANERSQLNSRRNDDESELILQAVVLLLPRGMLRA